MKIFTDQLADARAALLLNVDSYGHTLGEECAARAQPLFEWVHWYRMNRPSDHGKELLDGASAAILEAVGYVSCGMGRACISAIRTQIDLLLGYTYFREHPAEWRLVCETGDGFKLKSELVRYHRDMQPAFAQKLTFIEQSSGLSIDTVYRVLSAHIHGQSRYAVPQAGELKDLIWPRPRLAEVIKLQDQSARALSNFLLAVHAREWTELPPTMIASAKTVLSGVQIPIFFS